MNQNIVQEYFQLLIEEREYFKPKNSKYKIMKSFHHYAESSQKQISTRAIFTAVATWLGARKECTFWGLAAGVADTAIVGAGTVISGATGIGAVLGVAGTVSHYGNTIYYACNTCKMC